MCTFTQNCYMIFNVNNNIIITSLFREDDMLSNTNYLSDIWSIIIKLIYLNYKQFVQYIHIQYENVTFKSPCLGTHLHVR